MDYKTSNAHVSLLLLLLLLHPSRVRRPWSVSTVRPVRSGATTQLGSGRSYCPLAASRRQAQEHRLGGGVGYYYWRLVARARVAKV